jgi:hypothetical protein
VAGKFGSSAGEVIAEALVRARAEGTSRIGEEHLFAALLANDISVDMTHGREGLPGTTTLHNVHYRRCRGERRLQIILLDCPVTANMSFDSYLVVSHVVVTAM